MIVLVFWGFYFICYDAIDDLGVVFDRKTSHRFGSHRHRPNINISKVFPQLLQFNE